MGASERDEFFRAAWRVMVIEQIATERLVFVDEMGSSLLLPEVVPEYAGYVAWRGLVGESELDPSLVWTFSEKFTFFLGENTQILCYLIPGLSGGMSEGGRRLNSVWYWNVPEGDQLSEVLTDKEGVTHGYSVPQGKVREHLIERQGVVAEKVLPDVFSLLFEQTEEPFI